MSIASFTPSVFLIDADKPFAGHCASFLGPDGTVAYSGGMTVAEYEAARGKKLRRITVEALDQLTEAFLESRITDPTPETEQQFWDALEVLPPCRWYHVGGVELFHISERITANLVSWHGQIAGRYYTFTDRDDRPSSELAQKVREFDQEQAQSL